jgi:hypothetical protein
MDFKLKAGPAEEKAAEGDGGDVEARDLEGRFNRVNIDVDATSSGVAAAAFVAAQVTAIVEAKGSARVIFATGASQFAFIEELVAIAGLPWDKVECFHLDEYAGMQDTHPASFRKYLKERLFAKMVYVPLPLCVPTYHPAVHTCRRRLLPSALMLPTPAFQLIDLATYFPLTTRASWARPQTLRASTHAPLPAPSHTIWLLLALSHPPPSPRSVSHSHTSTPRPPTGRAL